MVKKETIIVFSAHSDDFVIGAGGTIYNYTNEGKKVIVVVFSYGENSHPWLKKNIIQKMRSEETLEACKLLNCEVIFFDLKEFNFKKEYEEKGTDKKLLDLLEKEKPSKVFTHSSEDPHPDHSAVNFITMKLFEKLKHQPELYIYSVWNPFSFKTTFPALCIDITKSFQIKLKALKTFRSQKIQVAYPFFLLLFRALREGIRIGKKFGEKFYRIK
ncbi:MAG TPA: PIG-L deacetylase family protein [Candidatus Nanoarchaeia archaeon]|nr:PIG-L deacetylase family protein [Candidatus Nanoarchaeia archaeon]